MIIAEGGGDLLRHTVWSPVDLVSGSAANAGRATSAAPRTSCGLG